MKALHIQTLMKPGATLTENLCRSLEPEPSLCSFGVPFLLTKLQRASQKKKKNCEYWQETRFVCSTKNCKLVDQSVVLKKGEIVQKCLHDYGLPSTEATSQLVLQHVGKKVCILCFLITSDFKHFWNKIKSTTDKNGNNCFFPNIFLKVTFLI